LYTTCCMLPWLWTVVMTSLGCQKTTKIAWFKSKLSILHKRLLVLLEIYRYEWVNKNLSFDDVINRWSWVCDIIMRGLSRGRKWKLTKHSPMMHQSKDMTSEISNMKIILTYDVIMWRHKRKSVKIDIFSRFYHWTLSLAVCYRTIMSWNSRSTF